MEGAETAPCGTISCFPLATFKLPELNVTIGLPLNKNGVAAPDGKLSPSGPMLNTVVPLA